MSRSEACATIHASALLIGPHGALLRGPSGAGKSALALDLIDHARARGDFARLIGDDRLALSAAGGRLIARPHPSIAGRVEIRGQGIVAVPFEPAGVIRLVVDLLDAASQPERLPPEDALETNLCGVALPRLFARADRASAAREIFSYLHGVVTN